MTILKYVGYAAFFLVSLIFGLYITFPWDIAKDRVLAIASSQTGMKISAEELKASGFMGVVAKDLKITPAEGEPIVFPEVRARGKLFAWLTGKKGFSVAMPIAQGETHADIVIAGDLFDVDGELEDIELALVPGLAQALNLPLSGKATFKADIAYDQKDSKNTEGMLKLKVEALKLEKGGKVSGIPVPELGIGDIDWQIPVEAGKATLKNLRIGGDSVDLTADGTITLGKPLGRSTLNLTVSFKPTEKLLKAEPLLGALLNNLQRARGDDGFYTYAVTGTLKKAGFQPKKK